ncbi:MAG: hypothetical protein FWG44_03865 [Oscillospiraceae bacterium]|nr:hypothetical protein [Oscillospiraceae bacterium]
MQQKRHGRKIKRSKNLYKKRKGSARKTLEIAVMIVIVAGLGLVGYAAGRPLVNFFLGGKEPAESANDPGALIENINNPPVEDDETINAAEATAESQPPESKNIKGAVFAPASVLDNSTSLAAYIQQAKNNGYTSVVLEMKDSTGYLFYASEYAQVKNTEIIKGTLTAEQIYSAFENTGVKPVVRLNAALDQLGPKHVGGVSYFISDGSSRWADARIEDGGKLWANPFLQGTRDYLSFLVGELSEAGFPEIIIANAIFPDFKGIDFTYIESEYTNINTRFDGLTGLMKTVDSKRGQAKLFLEMSVKDVVENYAGYHQTAEILRGKKDLDNNSVSLLLIYTKSDFGSELKTGESSSVKLPPDIAGLMNVLYKQAGNHTSGFDIVPAFTSAGLTDNETESIINAFEDLGFNRYIVR